MVSLSLVKMVSVVCTMHFIVEYRGVGSGDRGGGKVHASPDFGRLVNSISTGEGGEQITKRSHIFLDLPTSLNTHPRH